MRKNGISIVKPLLISLLIGLSLAGCNNDPVDIIDTQLPGLNGTVDYQDPGINIEVNEPVKPVATVASEGERLAYILNTCRYDDSSKDFPAEYSSIYYKLSLLDIDKKWIKECAIGMSTEPVQSHMVAIFKTVDEYKNSLAHALYNYRELKLGYTENRLPRQYKLAKEAQLFREVFNGEEYTIILMCPNSDLVKERVIEFLETPELITIDPNYKAD